jgi:hypothetical protein
MRLYLVDADAAVTDALRGAFAPDPRTRHFRAKMCPLVPKGT